MNTDLLEQIVKNIFANLLVIPSKFVKQDVSKSLKSKDFMLNEVLTFEVDNEVITGKIWGCQISAEDSEFKILLGDCTQINNIPEYCLIVQLKNAPAYGVYMRYTDLINYKVFSEPLIACTLNETDWLACNTYLQATFLAGMEQIKELGLSWNKCSNYNSHIEMMKSFIKYHDSYYDEDSE
jgi:hypothetical protein